ncbi:hypothetical protein [Parathalassolituus penaei]|uniref:Uncharacterized protein n=1 Tax=Parathalassolituus penaei TaxID=2997323 RepID=A0A9X3EEG8_9GAMM|nr:hypothetical protein [Parathalassolituus penaei]MCY0966108.1 hypothetical protein [Parathalassolituus penaei]
MKMTWSSRKGQSRRLNNDAAALAYAGDFLIAGIVDAQVQQHRLMAF